jgi:hypothetical protein
MDRALPIREDMAFQRRCWAFQSAGWIVMVGLLGLTAVGLFSKGP